MTLRSEIVRKVSMHLRKDVRIGSIVGLAMLVAACGNLAFLRGGDDSSAVSQTTINGNQLGQSSRPPVPKQRTKNQATAAEVEENNRIINAYGGVYSNRRVENQLAEIVSNLVAKSEVPSQSFRITILNSPAVNAFALPGGFLYITRGLLVLANDASEVAAVLAHEMAHVTSRHGQERLRQARQTALVSKAVQGVISDTSTLAAISQRQRLDFAAFTQNQELEADIVGVRNVGRAGYDPFAAARFLEVMADYQSYRTTATVAKKTDGPNFLSSHPSTPARIEKARLAARQFGAPGVGGTGKRAYLTAIDSMIFGDDPVEGFVRDRSFFHPQLRFTFSVPRGYIIDNGRDAVVATSNNGDQVRFDGVDLAANVPLDEYMKSGWLLGLDPNSVKSFTVNGAPAASATARVKEWHFRITVIRSQGATYRMIFATQRPSTEFDRSVSSTVSSFRPLSESEARSLAPLRIKIVQAKAGDNAVTMSREMRGLVANPTEAFKALNGLGRSGRVNPGDLVKVVVSTR